MIGRSVLEPSGLSLSRLALGAAPLGSLSSTTAQGVVAAAVDAGMTYVDTAPMYGAGRSETSVGAAVAGRDGVVVSTKAGRLVAPSGQAPKSGDAGWAGAPRLVWDMTATGMRRSLEESLRRLDRDHIELLYLHDPDDHEVEATEQALPELVRMRAAGLVRAIGVGMNGGAMPARLVDRFDLDAVLLAGRYTLLDQGGLHDVLPACEQRGVAVVLGGVFNSGVLADPRKSAVTYDNRPASAWIVERARAAAALAERHGVTLRALALQFAAAHPAVRSVLVGAASTAEVADAVAAFTTDVPDDAWLELRSAGFLDEAAPVPAGGRAE
ncbi:aldo/keto reductase [Jiangella asiatica]|uniref:aldo/keto reductase n=1 Tax=Jiangella asiatica TaxID=2530372 RepID=UPI00193E210C|nr:aldo/keto reductase [Jiangella asiatica]